MRNGIVTALVLATACSGGGGEALTASEAGATGTRDGGSEPAGHERMVAVLADIAARIPKQNPHLGDRPLKKRLRTLAAADASTPRKTLARMHYDVGEYRLRLGHVEEAVESFEACRTILEEFPRDQWPPFAANFVYDLAVAHMRLGETQNCVARHTSQSCLLPIEGEGVHVEQSGSRAAMRWFREVLATQPPESPPALAARWLLNVAAMTVDEYPDELSDEERLDPSVFASEADFPRFREVAPELGLDPLDLAGGAIADDFDNDGRVDLFTSTWDLAGQVHFFHNRGDGGFDERTREVGLEGIYGGLDLKQADYDGDGFVDVFVPRGAWLFGPTGEVPNSLLRNAGGERFFDVTFPAGLGEVHRPTQAAGWADYDLDGDLDLYVGNESTPTKANPCQLFRNEGDGTFQDVAEEAGVLTGYYTKGVAWGDYDGDRYPDLYASNLGSPNNLFRNRGDGTFEDVARELGVAWPMLSFPAWFWDFDNDGHLDLYVSSYDQGEIESDESQRLAPVVASYLGLPFQAELNRLYRGDGEGGFEEVAVARGMETLTLTMGSNFGDLDNDGFLDVYLGTGYPDFDGLIPNVMYWNRGGETFLDVTTAGGFGHLQKGHGVAFADFDDDGDLDVYAQMGGFYPGDAFGNALFENPGFGNRWLEVQLVGTKSNRSAIGARIKAVITEDGVPREIHRHVGSGSSFGANPLTQHLGLGGATSVDLLEVTWPCSGAQTFRDLPSGCRVRIVEGEEEPAIVEEAPFELGA